MFNFTSVMDVLDVIYMFMTTFFIHYSLYVLSGPACRFISTSVQV